MWGPTPSSWSPSAILPVEVLDMTRIGAINLHASLLPKYRGSSPINWAIVNGEAESGVTTMYMAEGLDTGDILLQATLPLDPRETAATLHDKLAASGGPLLVDTLHRLEAGNLVATPQDEAASSYIPKLTRDDGLLDWSLDAVTLDRRIRGFTPWPGAFTFVDGKRLNVRVAHPVEVDTTQPPGCVEDHPRRRAGGHEPRLPRPHRGTARRQAAHGSRRLRRRASDCRGAAPRVTAYLLVVDRMERDAPGCDGVPLQIRAGSTAMPGAVTIGCAKRSAAHRTGAPRYGAPRTARRTLWDLLR